MQRSRTKCSTCRCSKRSSLIVMRGWTSIVRLLDRYILWVSCTSGKARKAGITLFRLQATRWRRKERLLSWIIISAVTSVTTLRSLLGSRRRIALISLRWLNKILFLRKNSLFLGSSILSRKKLALWFNRNSRASKICWKMPGCFSFRNLKWTYRMDLNFLQNHRSKVTHRKTTQTTNFVLLGWFSWWQWPWERFLFQ